MKFSVNNSYRDLEYKTKERMPDAVPLNIISGGCHLYGYLLTPGDTYEAPHPAVIMFHGFPGYTTNNDLEYALMRMGCVVIHVNHRGAWGSEGNYLFSHLVDDAIAIAKWAHNPAVTTQYQIDEKAIFLVGHSMGGMTVLNAVGKLPFIRGVAAIAPYDLYAAFHKGLEKELFLMIEGEGQCLHMTSASAVYENAMEYSGSLSVVQTYDHLKDQNVLFVAATEDTVAPVEYMIMPVYDRLIKNPGKGQCELISLDTNHGLCGQRIRLAETLGRWMEQQLK
ncbi:MAG: alpha/beta hydrolase [Lachnospiraceae bacterium]|nr:alpha/beta hydrolase [Lachnospiraceae bacterium]